MKDQFLVLTTPENTEIIVGVANIAIIETNPDNPNQTRITFNYPVHENLNPHRIYVKEELGLIKNMIGI